MPHRNTPPSSDGEIDYSSRRMSSSAASDSSLRSRPDKRPFDDYSPSASPVPKRSRADGLAPADGQERWSSAHDDAETRSELDTDSPRVQLPSLASNFHDRHELRRNSLPTSLLENGNSRLRLPTPTGQHRSSQSQSGLGSYQFPAPPSDHSASSSGDEPRRPRISADTQLGLYDYPPSSTALSSSSSYSFASGNSPLSGSSAPPHGGSEDSSSTAAWASSAIPRPSSTPSQIPGALSPSLKYDSPDGLRPSQSASPLYGGVTRISGQHAHSHHHHHHDDRARSLAAAAPIKTESDWTFPSADFAPMSSGGGGPGTPSGLAAPSIAVTGSPGQRSPGAPASLIERPPRKRGKLPKPVTDYLKDWLHRHSDHPYPSEDEKKQLCNATGLSMSQVSNWMINVRVLSIHLSLPLPDRLFN